MFYSAKADALRAFLRDVLELPHKDVGGGWLIFDVPRAEIGVHPTDFPGAPASGTHDISLTTDDIEAVVAKLKAKGLEFDDTLHEPGYGRVLRLSLDAGLKLEIYQPLY